MTACARNPVTGGRALNFYSEAQEVQLGEDYHPQIIAEYGEYKNPALQEYVQDIVNRLGDVSHRPNLTYRATLLDTPEINAFAIPGGRVYVCRGLLLYANSEAELAGVLGHEIGHVNAQHSVQSMSKEQGFNLGLLLGGLLMASNGVATNNVNTALRVGQGVGTLAMLSYSREDEMEADRLGVEYAHKAGFSPLGVGRVMTMFERLGGKQDALSTALSTHPASEMRIKQARLEVKKLENQGSVNRNLERERYLSKISDLPLGAKQKYSGYLQIYTTQPGDTWEKLTQKYFAANTDPQRLAWLNDCELGDPLPRQIKLGLF
ncbi:putative Zn-dependent protease YfgC superfamily [Candidatus Termititenax persephonae]|uniref:Zn-dependent protease YfgC superfamily n=1 Tax=Candidatus Termititenax persephonae TaxID=2218525 RepID=A0A388TIJ7_9BACT|nr:putative Zn-dependent protease YfgC superfamily [Candidatus Termititenax persephonae]